MSEQFVLSLVDYEENVNSLAKFNRENLKCYQKKLHKTKFRCKATDKDYYTLWLVVSMDEMKKIANYCKIKNIKRPIRREDI